MDFGCQTGPTQTEDQNMNQDSSDESSSDSEEESIKEHNQQPGFMH
jgi:hypothetical protein